MTHPKVDPNLAATISLVADRTKRDIGVFIKVGADHDFHAAYLFTKGIALTVAEFDSVLYGNVSLDDLETHILPAAWVTKVYGDYQGRAF